MVKQIILFLLYFITNPKKEGILNNPVVDPLNRLWLGFNSIVV